MEKFCNRAVMQRERLWQPEKGIFRQGIAGGGGVYLECHWGEFVPCCRHGQYNKVFFLCVVCVDHLSSAADVRFVHAGVLVGTGREVLCGLAPYPELAIE